MQALNAQQLSKFNYKKMKKSPNPANHINYKMSKNQNNFNANLRKIRLIEGNEKCRHLNKLTSKATLRQVFIYLRPSRLLDFSLGWPCNFVGSESCQIQSVKLLQNMLSNRTPSPSPPPPHCIWIYNIPYLFTRERRGRGEQITKLGLKYQHDWLFNVRMKLAISS